MAYAFAPRPHPILSVANAPDVQLPVRRIFCVGRNYAEHAREMGNDPDREAPFFFTKPADAVIAANIPVPFPPQTENLHFEGELAVVLSKGGSDIDDTRSLEHVWGYAVANDLTRRDLQAEAKKMGRPWDMAKAFDNSAVVGPVHPVADVGHLSSGALTTHVNSQLRQEGDLADMIWSVPEVIAYLSRFVELAPGDVLLTGTPAGVGALQKGDQCTVSIEGLGEIKSTFV